MRFFLFLILLCLWSTPAFAAPAEASGSIKVSISGLQIAPESELRIALFRGEQGWPKFDQALQLQNLPVTSAQLSLSFSDLPLAEDYAILVHHDQNGNGKFDMRWFPYPRPKEGAGVSNNLKSFGSPAFSKARFSLAQPEIELFISVNY